MRAELVVCFETQKSTSRQPK